MFHRTQRLFLRPVFPDDWEAIFAGIADETVVRNLAKAPWPYRPKDAKAFAARGQDPSLPSFIVTEPTARGERLIGSAGLGEDAGEVEVGYWIAREYWGRGYASEALAGVIEVARMLGLDRLTAGHFLDNPASGRVLEKNGFTPTGRVMPRFSCGRGKESLVRQYERLLGAGMASGDEPQAA
ncbi:GNAT family N-acetyltransferase [Alteriqipengyuania sp. WL0013]|uniref:GNAT family N-acetyltransferase n=1 Tax=Alteriqipengyuania sp. WL0013 TaxID=3110773 RepID=UPI002CA6F82E|nr:GNAT family N-acetyltransferase [Alteriqipengyuania sp. WL0013]MEB3415520.1 GNAT family N-acetyltransferase [Alteriqipengyuania sp. WL0013]